MLVEAKEREQLFMYISITKTHNILKRESENGGGIVGEGEIEQEMGRNKRRDEEIGTYSRAYGGCESIFLLASSYITHDGWPFR